MVFSGFKMRVGWPRLWSFSGLLLSFGVMACNPGTLPQLDRAAVHAWSFLMEQRDHRTEVLSDIAESLGPSARREEREAVLAGLVEGMVKRYSVPMVGTSDPSRDPEVLARYGTGEDELRGFLARHGAGLREAGRRWPGVGAQLARLNAATGRILRAEKRFLDAVEVFNALRQETTGRFWASIMFFELAPRPTLAPSNIRASTSG